MGYLETAKEIYRKAAVAPEGGLCCTTSTSWALPDLVVPDRMKEMNYGCGTTVHPRDLAGAPTVVYVGVGGGLELLQFADFCRRPGAVVGVDPVAEMREAARRNLAEAARANGWFREKFVRIEDGDALSLPLPDESGSVVAQNCVFNIFEEHDLGRALAEAHRVLEPGGRFVLSDPIAPGKLPRHLRSDERLRAMCLSGALTYERYVEMLVAAGFGTIEIRARRPFRVLDPVRYGTERPVLLESIEAAAIKEPVPVDGPCVFAGQTAIYFGAEEAFDDGRAHTLPRDVPLLVCEKTAARLASLGRPDLLVTPPTWFYGGGGCC